MSIQRVNRGEKIAFKASTFNAFAAAADAHRAGSSIGVPDASARPWLIDVRNAGSVNLARFDAVQLGEPIIDDQANEIEFDRLAGFNVQYPDDPTMPGKIAILQEPIGPGGLGRAMIFGVSPAREIIVEDEGHDRAGFGSTGELVSAQDGPAVILWKSPPGQPVRRAVVALTQGSAPKKATNRWARVVRSTPGQIANQWDYDLEFVEVDDNGDWVAIPDEDLVSGRNTIEANNSDGGVQGNGVDADRLPAGFDIVPIGDGAVVSASGPHAVVEGVDDGYWAFSVANLVDGDC